MIPKLVDPLHTSPRRFLNIAAGVVAAASAGVARALPENVVAESTPGGVMKRVKAGVLDVAYLESGLAAGAPASVDEAAKGADGVHRITGCSDDLFWRILQFRPYVPERLRSQRSLTSLLCGRQGKSKFGQKSACVSAFVLDGNSRGYRRSHDRRKPS